MEYEKPEITEIELIVEDGINIDCQRCGGGPR